MSQAGVKGEARDSLLLDPKPALETGPDVAGPFRGHTALVVLRTRAAVGCTSGRALTRSRRWNVVTTTRLPWEASEVLTFPGTDQPVVEFMWNVGRTLRPNGEILEGNPVMPQVLCAAHAGKLPELSPGSAEDRAGSAGACCELGGSVPRTRP
jgi:hypothetical protein